MLIKVSPEMAESLEHVKEKTKIHRLAKYLNGEGNPKHPHIKNVVNNLSKEEVIEALFCGYEVN